MRPFSTRFRRRTLKRILSLRCRRLQRDSVPKSDIDRSIPKQLLDAKKNKVIGEMPLKNLTYINVIEQNREWGAEVFVNRGLQRQGIKTVNIDYRNNRFKLANKVRQLADCDALLLQRGEGFPIHVLSAFQRPKFFWASELVSRRRDQDRLIRSGLFEHVFFRTQKCIDTVVSKNWIQSERCSILLSGFDQSLFFPKPEIERDIDALFVGNLTERRRSILQDLKRMGLCVVVTKAYGSAMNSLFQRAKVVLNIHAEHFADTETRVFEVLGSGALLLSERLSEENPFIPERHFLEASTTERMGELALEMITDPDAAQVIRDEGYHEALHRHTYDARAREIADTISKYLLTYPERSHPHIKDSLRFKVRRKVEDWLDFSARSLLDRL